MKAGTTTLFDHLAGHPGVAPSRDKEPKYFARDNVFAQGPEWYDALWDWDPAVHRVAMEASTHYSFRHIHPATAARMAAHPGEFRIVYLVREPIARIESHYHHALAAGWRVADRPLDADLDPELVEPCRYAWQLDAFTDQFPRSSILVIGFDELTSDPSGTVERVLTHWDLAVDGFSVDAGHVRNASSSKVVSTRVHAARRLPGSTWLANRVSEDSRRRIKTLIGSGKAVPRLDAEARRSIRDRLVDDHRRLADEWGIDVSRWSEDASAN